MASGSESGREEFRWNDEGGGIGTEVGEEEGQGVDADEGHVVATTVLGRVIDAWVAPERIVIKRQNQHEHSHTKESHELNPPPPDPVYGSNRHPVARHGRNQCDQSLRSADSERLLQGTHRPGRWNPPDGSEDILLEQILAVKRHVQHEPTNCGAEQVRSMACKKLPAKQPVLNFTDSSTIHGSLNFLLLNYSLVIGLVVSELDVENLLHVPGSLAVVLLHQSRVPGSLRHFHAVVVSGSCWNGTEHEEEPPNKVRFRGSGPDLVDRERGSVVRHVEGRGQNDGHGRTREDSEALHGEHCSHESPSSFLVGVLRHDRRRQRVISSDSEAQPEAKKAQSDHDAGGSAAER
ncbi:hypothetical protein Mapa_012987 [Marchantia paleacea]|nr:hypothetical protein Mapa_012987 [Marchantia paleacea]